MAQAAAPQGLGCLRSGVEAQLGEVGGSDARPSRGGSGDGAAAGAWLQDAAPLTDQAAQGAGGSQARSATRVPRGTPQPQSTPRSRTNLYWIPHHQGAHPCEAAPLLLPLSPVTHLPTRLASGWPGDEPAAAVVVASAAGTVGLAAGGGGGRRCPRDAALWLWTGVVVGGVAAKEKKGGARGERAIALIAASQSGRCSTLWELNSCCGLWLWAGWGATDPHAQISPLPQLEMGWAGRSRWPTLAPRGAFFLRGHRLGRQRLKCGTPSRGGTTFFPWWHYLLRPDESFLVRPPRSQAPTTSAVSPFCIYPHFHWRRCRYSRRLCREACPHGSDASVGRDVNLQPRSNAFPS